MWKSQIRNALVATLFIGIGAVPLLAHASEELSIDAVVNLNYGDETLAGSSVRFTCQTVEDLDGLRVGTNCEGAAYERDGTVIFRGTAASVAADQGLSVGWIIVDPPTPGAGNTTTCKGRCDKFLAACEKGLGGWNGGCYNSQGIPQCWECHLP